MEKYYLDNIDNVQCSILGGNLAPDNLDVILYDLDHQLDLLKNHADTCDYIVAIASGVVCAMVDVACGNTFDIRRAHEIGKDEAESIVKQVAKKFGCSNAEDLTEAVRFLENRFPIPSDGNTPQFGGGLQHHLRDFGHHPTLAGLVFSLLTQFTGKSFGTDTLGKFIFIDVPEQSQFYIGKTAPEKVMAGTFTWFFHLVSDMAGSSGSAATTGGTGIPGPILSLAKEFSALPVVRDIQFKENSLSVWISKLFNGTALADHDEAGKIIKESQLRFDLRTEMGLATELLEQSFPVVLNDCIVRSFFLIRRLGWELSIKEICSLHDLPLIDISAIIPVNNPSLTRMLTISTGVFTGLDLTEAIFVEKSFLSVNYVGIGRFAIALGSDVTSILKVRNVERIRAVYQEIARSTYRAQDNTIYERIGTDMNDTSVGFGLTAEQVEILYNIQCLKTLHDVEASRSIANRVSLADLKREWIEEWKLHIAEGYPSFVNDRNAAIHWYSETELLEKIDCLNAMSPWYRLVLLEAMLFEPYYALAVEPDKKGKPIPSKKYQSLQTPLLGFNSGEGDRYLDLVFCGKYCTTNYVSRLRKCYKKCERELNEVQKTALVGLSITAGVAIVTIATAGALAPAIAVALVGSNFAGLSGAALTSACLAYLGGGAIAVGGAGMAGGTIAIVGGGAVLGIGAGAGIGGTVGAISLAGKRDTILQSAKLLTSLREIFLNDEHDLEYSNTVYEQYLQSIMDAEKGLVELKLQADVANGQQKKELTTQIKAAEKSIHAMKVARKSMLKFQSSFEIGTQHKKVLRPIGNKKSKK